MQILASVFIFARRVPRKNIEKYIPTFDKIPNVKLFAVIAVG